MSITSVAVQMNLARHMLSPVTEWSWCTGAVSRYNLSRSQKFIKVKGFNCRQMRALPNVAERSWVSGCNGHYKFVLGAGVTAKTVTNNLPILSVLAFRANVTVNGYQIFQWQLVQA